MQSQEQQRQEQMGGALAEAPRAIGTLTLADGQGVSYVFTVYPARAPLLVSRAVFAFSRLEGIWPEPVFIGCAGEWPLRLALHPARERALAMGAIHLLVHSPEPGDPVQAREAAERLVAWHAPVLNRAEAARRAGLAAAAPAQERLLPRRP